VVSGRVGGVWKPQRLGVGQAAGGGGGGGGMAVHEGRAMVQGGTRDELTTCPPQTDCRPIDFVKGGTVQATPSCEMSLTKRLFPGLLPASLLWCAQPRSTRSEVFRPPMTRSRGRRQREVQPWRPAAPHNLDDAWAAFLSADREPSPHQSARTSRSRPATGSPR